MTPAPVDEQPIEQQPAEIPDEQAESPYGPRNEKLPLQLVNVIAATIKEHAEQERFTRRREVLEARKLRFYEQSSQHVYEGRNGVFMQGTPGATDGSAVPPPAYLTKSRA